MSEYEVLPVRCFTCGKVLGHLQKKYMGLIKDGYTIKEALDTLELERMCCRTNVMNPIKLSPAEDIVVKGHETGIKIKGTETLKVGTGISGTSGNTITGSSSKLPQIISRTASSVEVSGGGGGSSKSQLRKVVIAR